MRAKKTGVITINYIWFSSTLHSYASNRNETRLLSDTKGALHKTNPTAYTNHIHPMACMIQCIWSIFFFRFIIYLFFSVEQQFSFRSLCRDRVYSKLQCDFVYWAIEYNT